MGIFSIFRRVFPPVYKYTHNPKVVKFCDPKQEPNSGIRASEQCLSSNATSEQQGDGSHTRSSAPSMVAFFYCCKTSFCVFSSYAQF